MKKRRDDFIDSFMKNGVHPRITWDHENGMDKEIISFDLEICDGCKALTTVILMYAFHYCKNCIILLFDSSLFTSEDYEKYFLTKESKFQYDLKYSRKEAQRNKKIRKQLKEEQRKNKIQWEEHRTSSALEEAKQKVTED
jgi:hypothetical protein